MHFFIHGPSGSGKSYLAGELARAKDAKLIEIDIPGKDGMKETGLKTEWDEFIGQNNFSPMETELDKRAAKAKRTGCVISLPGFPLLKVKHARKTKGKAVICYLAGTPGQCLDSFVEREKKTGRDLPMTHWASHNQDFFPALKDPTIAPLIIQVFKKDGSRRSASEIISEIDNL